MAEDTLAKRVASLRESAGLTQAGLAEKAGVPLYTIRHIEQGTTANPRLDTMKALAKALGVDMNELAGE